MLTVVGPAAWQDTGHDDRVGFVVEVEAHAPVADTDAPLGRSGDTPNFERSVMGNSRSMAVSTRFVI
jgi:hypothetical protein